MLTLLNQEEIIAIYNKYMVKDFPPDELKPLSSILDMLSRGIYACYGIFEDNKFLRMSIEKNKKDINNLYKNIVLEILNNEELIV